MRLGIPGLVGWGPNSLLLNRGTIFHEACEPKGALPLLMTFVIPYNTYSGRLGPSRRSTHYVSGLRASVRPIHWRTHRVRASYPVHHTSMTNALTHRVRVPLHSFTYTLGRWILSAPGPLSVQPVDGLIVFGLLTPFTISSMFQVFLHLDITQSPLLVHHQRHSLLDE